MRVRITGRERSAILSSLAAGVVPSIGLHHIQVGRKDEVNALLSDLVKVENELSEPCREFGGDDPTHQLVVYASICDQVSYRDDLESELIGHGFQPGQPGHRPVVIHDFAQDPGRHEPGKPCQVNDGFRMPGPAEHAAPFRPQREDVPGPCQIFRSALGIDERFHGFCPVLCRNAGGRSVHGVHGDGEARTQLGRVIPDHGMQIEFIQTLSRHGRTD